MVDEENRTDEAAEDVAHVQADAATEPVESAAGPAKRRLRWWQKLLIGLAMVVGVLLLLGASLYYFGGMSGSVYDPDIERQYEQLVASGQVQPVESRFVLPIPGCKCHSTDPVLTQQHRARRIYMCMSCHGE